MPAFGREYTLTLDTIQTSDLDVSFKVEKTLKAAPNRAEIAVLNLSPSNRKALSELTEVSVKLEAGYRGETFVVFLGDLRDVNSARDGADIVTTVSGGDGEQKIRVARVNKSYGPKTSVKSVLDDLAKAVGVKVGNAAEKALAAKLEGAGSVFSEGTVTSGAAYEELNDLATSVGLELSIQDGEIQLLDRGQPISGEIAALTPDTGLIGAPELGSDGILRARSLLVPRISPGKRLQIQSAQVDGVFRIERCVYSGDTSGPGWYIDVEAKAL